MPSVDLRNPPNEMPDIVGFRPESALLANFRPLIPASARLREFTAIPIILGTLLGIVFWRVLALPCTQGRFDGERVDSGGGARNYLLPRGIKTWVRRFDGSRKQHSPNCRLGR